MIQNEADNILLYDPNELISENELARRIMVSVPQLRRLRVRKSTFRYYKLGASVRYRWGEVCEDVEQLKVIPIEQRTLDQLTNA